MPDTHHCPVGGLAHQVQLPVGSRVPAVGTCGYCGQEVIVEGLQLTPKGEKWMAEVRRAIGADR